MVVIARKQRAWAILSAVVAAQCGCALFGGSEYDFDAYTVGDLTAFDCAHIGSVNVYDVILENMGSIENSLSEHYPHDLMPADWKNPTPIA